ncbi:hypothetical protein pEaSNUABM54_00303 [Erwinia phage pEa_SNUABM_54]|nr:hypothetical protein pEaSNUABM54_00303 [Erwinia phage pEa_SNUABM_54]
MLNISKVVISPSKLNVPSATFLPCSPEQAEQWDVVAHTDKGVILLNNCPTQYSAIAVATAYQTPDQTPAIRMVDSIGVERTIPNDCLPPHQEAHFVVFKEGDYQVRSQRQYATAAVRQQPESKVLCSHGGFDAMDLCQFELIDRTLALPLDNLESEYTD